jgi:hypothetical protein
MTRHPDSAAVDRVGTANIVEHFQITPQAVSKWRRDGVPKVARHPLVALGQRLGHDMSDFVADVRRQA